VVSSIKVRHRNSLFIQRERQNKYFQIRVCCSGTWRCVLTWTPLVRQVLSVSVPPPSQLDSALTGSRKQLTCVSVCPAESLLPLHLWTICKFKLSCLFLLCNVGKHVHFLFQNKLWSVCVWRQIYMIIRLLINWNQSTWWSDDVFLFVSFQTNCFMFLFPGIKVSSPPLTSERAVSCRTFRYETVKQCMYEGVQCSLWFSLFTSCIVLQDPVGPIRTCSMGFCCSFSQTSHSDWNHSLTSSFSFCCWYLFITFRVQMLLFFSCQQEKKLWSV